MGLLKSQNTVNITVLKFLCALNFLWLKILLASISMTTIWTLAQREPPKSQSRLQLYQKKEFSSFWNFSTLFLDMFKRFVLFSSLSIVGTHLQLNACVFKAIVRNGVHCAIGDPYWFRNFPTFSLPSVLTSLFTTSILSEVTSNPGPPWPKLITYRGSVAFEADSPFKDSALIRTALIILGLNSSVNLTQPDTSLDKNLITAP